MTTVEPVQNNESSQSNEAAHQTFLSFAKSLITPLLERKPMLEVQSGIHTKLEFQRTLNWILLLAIGVGCTIGAGIFVLSGQAAANYAGPSVIISFVLTGIIAFLSALSFSELATMMPFAGSFYTYTYVALGEYLAWFIGWNSVLLYLFGVLVVSGAWSRYVVKLIDMISGYNVTRVIVEAPIAWDEKAEKFYITGQVINLLAIAIIAAITILLIIGIRQAAIVNFILVVIKVVILLIFIFACCPHVERKNYDPFFPPNLGTFSDYGVTGMLQASTYVFFAYVGFDTVASAAQEVKLRERSLPIALIGSVTITLLLYVGISTVMVGLVPYKLLDSDTPLHEAIKATYDGLWLKVLMNLGGITSLATVVMTVMLAQVRIFYAMADDGLLPPIFAKMHPKRNTPWISTLICGIFCAVFSALLPVDVLGQTTSIGALVTYIFVHISVIVMRWTHRDMPRAFKVPCGRWLIPTIGSLLCVLLMKAIPLTTVYRFLAWTAIGQVFYFSYGFWHSKRRLLRKSEKDKDGIEHAQKTKSHMEIYTLDHAELDLADATTENEA